MSNDIPSFATHPDVFCPTDQPTFLVDCGALTACLETATGKKMTVLGKPDPGMLITAAEKLGIQPDECLMCGDRLQTDIAVGTNAGTVTCYIYHEGAPESDIPDYTVDHLGCLIPLWD
jgi:ribonucleotide monophosphatase NagD (HAD superfamily)